MSRKTARQKAIMRRNLFLTGCACVLILIGVLAGFAVKKLTEKPKPEKPAETTVSSDQSEQTAPVSGDDTPSYPAEGPNGLDANYRVLLLVNGKHPLPENYEYEKDLITIPQEYKNGQLDQINKDIWPYMKAMIDAAWADGVKLYVWSPYRSYAIQNMLFQKQVNRVKTADMTTEQAEELASTVVARPGTSEHHTGLAADFNMADDRFEQTEMFAWLQEHAADYGFIMRYAGDKQAITGVIHESWHYRFVGINTAKEINRLGMCLEEYLEHIGEMPADS